VYYQSLPLCVIDTVFSIGARYTSTSNTVQRFCTYFNVNPTMTTQHVALSDHLSIPQFLALYDQYGVEMFATHIYQNRQRTSTRNGILKAEAVLRFSRVLNDFDINYMQDTPRIVGVPTFESAIQQIPGQTSNISLRYFYMLIGEENYIKPDRMIARFIEHATGKQMTIGQMHTALVEACQLLQDEYPYLKPAILDNLIWQYQRTR
jgi:hypothetical protein